MKTLEQRVKQEEKLRKLETHPSCKGCQKDCKWRGMTTLRNSISTSHVFGCNSQQS